MEMTEL